jgi:formamidopyrimidine-DNA glycosylase
VPELPEVETIRAGLEPVLTGRRLERVQILDSRLTRPDAPGVVAGALEGDRVRAVTRRGKYLVLELASGRHLLVHLRMTGSFRHGRNGALDDDPHRRAVVRLDDGSDVAYRDIRRFGTWELLDAADAAAYLRRRLGAEPLGREFTVAALAEALARRRAPVKAVLLDQRAVAGMGNIYADEALWSARIHPLTPARELVPGEVAGLHRAIRRVLRAGITRHGATLRDYRDPAGEAGSMQEEFRVYGRGGRPCRRCRTPIVKTRVAGRGTWLCPACQQRAGVP